MTWQNLTDLSAAPSVQRTASEADESTQNQDEEDEFQEAARYRRGDGHLA